MTSFPRGGAENTAPPRCFCRQKRNGLEAGKRESGDKSGKKKRGKKGKTKVVRIGKGTTAENGKARGQPRGETEEKKEAPRRRDRSVNLRGAPLGAPAGHDLTRHPPGRTLSGAKNKKTPPQRGGVNNYLLLVHTGAVSRRGKHGVSRDPAISHPRAPTGEQSALGRWHPVRTPEPRGTRGRSIPR